MSSARGDVRKRFSIIGFPIIIFIVCFYFIDNSVWETTANGLITALALFIGAILLRIMRAFPIMDPRAFGDKGEIKSLEFALITIMKQLSIAACALSFALALLVFQPSLSYIEFDYQPVDQIRGEIFSGLVGGLIAFSILRIVHIVRLDFDVLRTQAQAVSTLYDRLKEQEMKEAIQRDDDRNFRFTDAGDYPGRQLRRDH